MELRKTLENVKTRIGQGCSILDKKIGDKLQRSCSFEGDADSAVECAYALSKIYSSRGYHVQRFRFSDQDIIGYLVQVQIQSNGWKQSIARTIGGQQIAVNVRILPKGRNLEVTIDCGKWVDKALSGVIAWSVFAPLLIFPIAGAIKQKNLISNIETDIRNWINMHRQSVCIDV